MVDRNHWCYVFTRMYIATTHRQTLQSRDICQKC